MHKKSNNLQSGIFSKNSFESEFWAKNQTVCGIDEVGRGCLAGPLVTAAVILPLGTNNPNLQDSKIMTEKERLQAARWITKNCSYGFGIVHNRIIDTHNIWQATMIAMKKALMQVMATSNHRPGAILIDAMPLDLSYTNCKDIPVYHFPKGEQLSSSIAAASIIAKVKRDAIMDKLDSLFPGYYFEDHKGYGTKKHQQAIATLSNSIIHRTSFTLKKEIYAGNHQQRIC